MNSFSQASQDIFVLTMLKYKTNGVYLEIGSNCPQFNSNTCSLYNQFNWTGLMVEFDKNFEFSYKISRPLSHHIFDDARNIDYFDFLEKNNYPKNIDYLQIDLDAENRSTLDVLEYFDKHIFDTYKFATVTFEHDFYRENYFDTRKISREIFLKHGYIMVFKDVNWNSDEECNYYSFEDWYIHPSLVDMNHVNRFKTDEILFHKDIKNRLLQNT